MKKAGCFILAAIGMIIPAMLAILAALTLLRRPLERKEVQDDFSDHN